MAWKVIIFGFVARTCRQLWRNGKRESLLSAHQIALLYITLCQVLIELLCHRPLCFNGLSCLSTVQSTFHIQHSTFLNPFYLIPETLVVRSACLAPSRWFTATQQTSQWFIGTTHTASIDYTLNYFITEMVSILRMQCSCLITSNYSPSHCLLTLDSYTNQKRLIKIMAIMTIMVDIKGS